MGTVEFERESGRGMNLCLDITKFQGCGGESD